MKKHITLLISLFALIFSLGVHAEQATSNQTAVDPQRYKVIPTPIPVPAGKKVEVMELFWYGCGHCFSIEPYVKKWTETLPDNVEFKKVPAVFSKRWEFHAKAFYTMEVLGVLDKANYDFFNALHTKRIPINTLSQLVNFLSNYDLNEDQVTKAFNSFAVANKVRQSKKISRDSGATGVPAFIVDGKYLTSISLNGDEKRLFQTIDGLIKKAAAEKK